MGAEQSKGDDQNTYEQILAKYQIVKKVNHPSFGDIQILKDKSSEDLMGLKEFNLTDENEFQKTIEKFKPKLLLDNPNLIRLQNYVQQQESQFCSTFFKVYLLFEYVENTLEQEVLERSKDVKQAFSEEEMWNILTSAIQGTSFLYQNKLTHCNIRPSTVFITQNGIVKIADPTLFSQPVLYATAITNPTNVPSGIYISPELLNDMYQQQYNPIYNQQKSDVFSLGMSMLHAALLQPLDDCYDYKNFTINEQLINERLYKVRENYGENLYNFLSFMLVFNAEERQDLTYFHSIISQQGEYSETAQFQQAEGNQHTQQSMIQQVEYSNRAQKSHEKVYQPYEIITTKTATTTTSVKNDDDRVKKSAAQTQQPQQQIILSKINNAPGGYSSAGMYKDSEDKGSQIIHIPKDQTSKNAIPDENIGNAIGGGNGASDNYYQSQIGESNFGASQSGPTTTNYAFSQNYTTYVPPVQAYNPIVQDYSAKYTPITTNTVTYTTSSAATNNNNTNSINNISNYTPLTISAPPAQKYSSTYLPTNTYEVTKTTTEVPASTIGGAGSGYYVSTREQQQQPSSLTTAPLVGQTTITTSQYNTDLSKPYTSTSYGLKENNFSYTAGPTIGTTGITSSGVNPTASTLPAVAAQTTTSYTTSNLYTSPIISNQYSAIKKDESIEEAIKRSAPPPLKNSINNSSPYTVSSTVGNASSATNQINSYIPTSNILTQPLAQNVTTTTTVTNNASTTPVESYKTSDEIDAILAKYRLQQGNIGNSTNVTDIKVSSTAGTSEIPQASGAVTTTTTYTSSATPSYQPYTPSQGYTSSINQTNVSDLNKPSGIENLNGQFGGLNLSNNQPSSNIAVSQVQSNYTANFNPNFTSNVYQPTSNISSTTSAPYNQQYNISQSFGQSNKPFTGQYESNIQAPSSYIQASQKEYVIEDYSNNSKYEGEKFNGMRHGRGKFYYQDGGLFDGEWRENKMHGRGVLSYASGKPAYDGDWVDDKFEGFGVLYNENPASLHYNYDFNDFDNVEEYWTKYEGQFKDDNKEGFGTLYLSNGEKFVGTFYKDFVNGSGTFYTLSGDVVQGTWSQNKLVD